MEKILYFIIFKIFIFLKNFLFSSEQMRYFPEKYIQNDLIFPDNDIIDEFQYNLVDAKVLTKNKITYYIKKQGINLDQDDCCEDHQTLDAWNNNDMKSFSELEEIYSNAVYSSTKNTLTYKFPVPRIETIGYTLYHKVWIFDKGNSDSNCRIFFTDYNSNRSNELGINLSGGKVFVSIEITYDESNKREIVKITDGGTIQLSNFNIYSINFRFIGKTYSPAASLHWTYYKTIIGKANFSLKGTDLCSEINPCIKGYVCVGGLCERCHPSCFDCKNGVLSTDCETKCSTHSTLLTPDRGSCPYSYVDLTQFDSFTLKDLVPPTRNSRLTISYWLFMTSFPENPSNGASFLDRTYRPGANLSNSFDDNVNFTFYFTDRNVNIECGGLLIEGITLLNTWYFVKCTNTDDFGDHFFMIKLFQNNQFNYTIKRATSVGDGSGTNCSGKRYLEPTDYITVWIENFNSLYNTKVPCNIYIKQLAYFREYVPDPYDNKYFSFEKIFTSSFELPEVLFIIPFDELIRNDNRYDIKCYSYAGSILENRITLTPYYYNKNYTYYPSKLFKRLNLLERNKKYTSPDLIKTEDVLRDNNTLIASYDYVPLTCIDNFFLTYDKVNFKENLTPNTLFIVMMAIFQCMDYQKIKVFVISHVVIL